MSRERYKVPDKFKCCKFVRSQIIVLCNESCGLDIYFCNLHKGFLLLEPKFFSIQPCIRDRTYLTSDSNLQVMSFYKKLLNEMECGREKNMNLKKNV